MVISLRKVLIGFVSILLTSKGSMLQSLVLFVLLILSIFQTLRSHPYEDYRVNRLEVVSLLALLVTAYCGIFFLSDRNSSSPDFQEGRDRKPLSPSHPLRALTMVPLSLGVLLEPRVLPAVAQPHLPPRETCPLQALSPLLRPLLFAWASRVRPRSNALQAQRGTLAQDNSNSFNSARYVLSEAELEQLKDRYKSSNPRPNEGKLDTLILDIRSNFDALSLCPSFHVSKGSDLLSSSKAVFAKKRESSMDSNDSLPSTRRQFMSSTDPEFTERGIENFLPQSLFAKSKQSTALRLNMELREE